MSDHHEDNIHIYKVLGTHGKGNWQAIGYYGDQHIAAFGFSPVEALEKAMSELKPAEELKWKKYEPTVGPDQQELEDMFG